MRQTRFPLLAVVLLWCGAALATEGEAVAALFASDANECAAAPLATLDLPFSRLEGWWRERAASANPEPWVIYPCSAEAEQALLDFFSRQSLDDAVLMRMIRLDSVLGLDLEAWWQSGSEWPAASEAERAWRPAPPLHLSAMVRLRELAPPSESCGDLASLEARFRQLRALSSAQHTHPQPGERERLFRITLDLLNCLNLRLLANAGPDPEQDALLRLQFRLGVASLLLDFRRGVETGFADRLASYPLRQFHTRVAQGQAVPEGECAYPRLVGRRQYPFSRAVMTALLQQAIWLLQFSPEMVHDDCFVQWDNRVLSVAPHSALQQVYLQIRQRAYQQLGEEGVAARAR